MKDNNTRSAEELFPSGHQPPSDYERPAEHARIVCDKDIAVPMRDGVNVVVDVYRPDAPGRFPVLLAFGVHSKELQGNEYPHNFPAATLVVEPVARSRGSRRHGVLRIARLCACDRLAARLSQIGRRRLARMGQLRRDRVDCATALVRRQYRHDRHRRVRFRAISRRAPAAAKAQGHLPLRPARRLRQVRRLPRGISGRRAACLPLFDGSLRVRPHHPWRARRPAA